MDQAHFLYLLVAKTIKMNYSLNNISTIVELYSLIAKLSCYILGISYNKHL